MSQIRAAITGVGGYVPEYILTNTELEKLVETNDEWITTRTGIKERRILKGEGLGTSHLAAKAVEELLAKTNTNPEDVDLILVATVTPDYAFPSTANLVGDMATKLSGEIGQVFGTRILLCDEFASPAVSKVHAACVYTRNYVMPRLRGVTIESDYEVANQRRVLVASQRLGFTDLIDGATSVHIRSYKAS